MKISLITTVLNEEKSIKSFLDSVLSQKTLPNEVVIVDGGSTDATASVISNFESPISPASPKLLGASSFQFKLIKKRGNRSVGRNTAIKNSTGDIITVSDVGCILDKNWLKNITEPFKDGSVDVVSGFYKPVTRSVFEKSLSTYTCVMPDNVYPKSFLPSSRSVAFRKRVWLKVGGYPEHLDTCEDLVFARKLKRAGFKFHFAENAIVHWPQKKNIFQAAMQFFTYAVGDGQALYIRPQTPFLFARYTSGAVLVALYLNTKSNLLLSIIYYLIAAYIVWAVWKNYKYVRHLKAFLYLPVLQITSDIAVICGMTIGFLKRFMRI